MIWSIGMRYGLDAALDDAGGLPDDEADLPEWFDNMTPDQGAAIAAAFPG